MRKSRVWRILFAGVWIAPVSAWVSPASAEAPKGGTQLQSKPPATFHPNKKSMPEQKAPLADSGASTARPGKYVLQVAVFETLSHAESLVAKLKASGLPAYHSDVENPSSDLSETWYRVRIGGFASREEAKAFGEKNLTPQGINFWVDLKTNDHVGRGTGVASKPALAPPPPAEMQSTAPPAPKSDSASQKTPSPSAPAPAFTPVPSKSDSSSANASQARDSLSQKDTTKTSALPLGLDVPTDTSNNVPKELPTW